MSNSEPNRWSEIGDLSPTIYLERLTKPDSQCWPPIREVPASNRHLGNRRYQRYPTAGTIWTIILLNPIRAPYDEAATPALGNERRQRFPNRTSERRSPGGRTAGSGSRHRLRT